MEGFQINYTDLSDLFWEYKRKIENLIENIDNCIERINMFTENAVFTGKTGDAVKSYLGEAHITILSGIKVTAQTLLDNMAAYKDGYRAIDSSTNFKLDEEAIQEFRKKLASNYEDTDEYTGKIRSALSEVSDISDVGMPDSNGVFDIHEQMDSDLIKLVSNVNSYERENVVRLENSVELLLENLQSCLSKIGLSQGAIESYETGSFITGKDAGTLNTGIKIFGDLHEKNKEAYDEIYETEQNIKDEAEKRKTQGIWRTVGGAVLIATGAACIVLTGGAAIPIVADVAVAVGSGTAVFGAADAIEGTQDIYYGSTGDIDSTAVNGIKDDLFQGNEDVYYLTENAFAFAASAMIPIGQASTAGNLTFKSTATIVAKEGISMGAGAGAQKITTDVTGNDTAGMVVGMVASGVTAAEIEKGANKFGQSKIKNTNQEQAYFGETWKNYFDEKYGAENVKWESEVISRHINYTDISQMEFPNVEIKGGTYNCLNKVLKKYDLREIEYLNLSITPQHKLNDNSRKLVYNIRMDLTSDVTDDFGIVVPGTRICKSIDEEAFNSFYSDGDNATLGGCIALQRDIEVMTTDLEIIDSTGLRFEGSNFVDDDGNPKVFYIIDGELKNYQSDLVVRVSATTEALNLSNVVEDNFMKKYPNYRYNGYFIGDINSSNETYLNEIWTRQSKNQIKKLAEYTGIREDNIVIEEAR